MLKLDKDFRPTLYLIKLGLSNYYGFSGVLTLEEHILKIYLILRNQKERWSLQIYKINSCVI